MIFLEEHIPEFSTNLFVMPILSDVNKHWSINRVSFIYIYDIESRCEYILSVNHNDSNKLLIDSFNFTTKKQFIHNSKYINCQLDSNVLVWLQYNKVIKSKIPEQIISYYRKFSNFNNVNDFVPIVLFYPYLRDVRDIFLAAYHKFNRWEAFDSYCLLKHNLSIVEKNGLYTTYGYEYSEYNLFTLTGRPSNNYGGVNYAALNKSDGSRSRFISRFGDDGYLIEFDLKSFHIHLISLLIDYSIDGDAYDYLSRYYDDGVNAKDETFHQIYGGISDKYLHIDFFRKTKEFTSKIYTLYQKSELKSILFSRDMNIPNLSNVKIFNYILQSFETEFNSYIISEINHYLYNRHSKLVLYTYDSFLIDFCKNDGKDTISGLKNIFQSKCKYHLSVGKNYNDIVNIV